MSKLSDAREQLLRVESERQQLKEHLVELGAELAAANAADPTNPETQARRAHVQEAIEATRRKVAVFEMTRGELDQARAAVEDCERELRGLVESVRRIAMEREIYVDLAEAQRAADVLLGLARRLGQAEAIMPGLEKLMLTLRARLGEKAAAQAALPAICARLERDFGLKIDPAALAGLPPEPFDSLAALESLIGQDAAERAVAEARRDKAGRKRREEAARLELLEGR